MSEGESSRKAGKSGNPKDRKKPEVGSPKPEEENNSAPYSYRDDIPKSELNKSDPDSYRDEHPTSEIKALQTEPMEIHHHPDLHHKKKRWKEYLLEFLMIFLAVTLGFLARP